VTPHFLRFVVGAGFLVVLLSQAPGQDAKDAPKKQPEPDKAPPPAKAEPPRPADETRQLFKEPQSTAAFWERIQFEMEVGKYDLAAAYLHGLLDRKPTDEELFNIESRVGMAAFLALRNVPKWSDDAKVNAQALKDVEDLIARATEAVRKTLKDPERIKKYVANLNASPEEFAYALRELYRSGAEVVPYLLDELRTATGAERLNLLKALRRLGPDTLAPMVAALDGNDVQLKVDLLDVFKQRAASAVVPDLWFLAGSSNQSETVRRKATETLAYLLETPANKLPSPKTMLTHEAERYYDHQVAFSNPEAVTIWRWDGKGVVAGWPGAPTVSATRAEEYYGLRYAGQALALDPTYQPAQVVLLSLALDKGYERAGLTQPLSKTAPKVHELLATVSPELLIATLDRALTDRRTPVVLGAARALGDLGEVRATRPSGRGEPALVRALNYPDRRVQMAAADALLRIPGGPAPNSAARVVEILRRALAAEPKGKTPSKVIVGFGNEDFANKVADAVVKAGYEPIKAHTGRDVLRRLNEAADVDLLLIDAALPEPGLTSLLAQLRADVNAANLPLVLTAAPDREENLSRLVERYRNVIVIPIGLALEPRRLSDIFSRIRGASGPALSDAEMKEYAEKAIRYLSRMAKGELSGYEVRPAAEVLLNTLRDGGLSNEGQQAAVEAAARLPGARPQTELANVVLDAKRPLPLRTLAAEELVRHVQQHGAALGRNQIGALEGQLAAGDTPPALKADLALLVGSLHPDARLTGERLLRYQPPTPPQPPKDK
jgi:CheY-like chemotaxis protein